MPQGSITGNGNTEESLSHRDPGQKAGETQAGLFKQHNQKTKEKQRVKEEWERRKAEQIQRTQANQGGPLMSGALNSLEHGRQVPASARDNLTYVQDRKDRLTNVGNGRHKRANDGRLIQCGKGS